MATIQGFAGHAVPVATTHPCWCGAKAATDEAGVNGHGCVSLKFTGTELWTSYHFRECWGIFLSTFKNHLRTWKSSFAHRGGPDLVPRPEFAWGRVLWLGKGPRELLRGWRNFLDLDVITQVRAFCKTTLSCTLKIYIPSHMWISIKRMFLENIF